MSESSRKRSRKSKIVLRECVVSDEENDTFKQEYPHNKQQKILPKTNHIQKIKNKFDTERNNPTKKPTQTNDEQTKNNDKNETKSPIKFSVTVAIEKFDEDSNDLVIDETNYETPLILAESSSNYNPDIEVCNVHTDWPTGEGCVLKRDDIIEAANKIMEESTNSADQMLAIATKNCLGHFPRGYLNRFETKIHKSLLKWMYWQNTNGKHKSTPLYYKCYICAEAWWYLYEFREHLKSKHDQFKLELEKNSTHEANIVAFLGNSFKIKDFDPKGNCPKCDYDAAFHRLENRSKDNKSLLYFICKISNCGKSFPTCYALKSHEYTDHITVESSAVKWRKTCEVCSVPFHTHSNYEAHMSLMHNARSDTVVAIAYKKCHLCKCRYLYNHMLHTCIMKGLSLKCSNCFRMFPKGYLFKLHVNRMDNYTCKICNTLLPKRCMEVEHLLTHTDKFAIVKKCILCKEFKVFLTDETALEHGQQIHKSNLSYFDAILIPKICLQTDTNPNISEQADEVSLLNIKAEPQDSIDSSTCIYPEVHIKQEITDSEYTGDSENGVQVKQETDNDMQEEYNIKIEEQEYYNIYDEVGESKEIMVKQEMQEDDFEDIIQLDFNYIDTQDTVQDDIQEPIKRIICKKNKGPKIYNCDNCGFGGVLKQYREHIKNNCMNSTETICCANYACTKCCTNFKTIKQYILHFTEHGFEPLTCPVCYKTFSTVSLIISHINVHIRMRFLSVQFLNCNNDTRWAHKCKICLKEFSNINFFKHWESHLSLKEEPPIDVDVCTTDDKNLTVDQDAISKLVDCLLSPEYGKKTIPACIICNKNFQRRNDSKRHMIEHLLTDAYQRKPKYSSLKCQICSKCYIKSYDYKQHMRDHANLPVYKCQMCKKSFSDSSNFAKHKKVHNIHAYTCDICGKKFNAKFSIEKHIQMHEHQKPIPCPQCDKIFTIPSMYKKHIKTHTNKAQFTCIDCGQKFDSLKKKWDHMWEVHKERKYLADCALCPQKFRKFRDLNHHLRIKHNTMLEVKPLRGQDQGTTLDDIFKMRTLSVSLVDQKETLVVFE